MAAHLDPIHQTLHGYDQGHRLLAASLSLDPPEKRLLDRLSDLSGYLPTGFTWTSYVTLFPCGRFYACARTWSDVDGVRTGTVLTHTLLVPVASLAASTLEVVNALWRKPASSKDITPYQVELAHPPHGKVFGMPPATSPDLALLRAQFLTRPERPLIWVGTRSDAAFELVRAFWQTWPLAWLRDLSLCTLALRPRFLGGEIPFDLLFVPREARGSFHEFLRQPGWVVDGVPDEVTRKDSESPAYGDLLHDVLQGLQRLYQLCSIENLPLPRPDRTHQALRALELLAKRPSSLSAVRGAADLLQLAWPDVGGEHPLWHKTLHQLLVEQHSASLEPRPLWDLIDLCRRPTLSEGLATDPTLRPHFRAVVGEQLGHTLRQATSSALVALSELVGVLQYHNEGELIEDVLVSEMSRAWGGAPAPQLLRWAFVNGGPGLLRHLFAALDPSHRLTVMTQSAHEWDTLGPQWWEQVATVARELRDPALLLTTMGCDSDPDGLLREVITLQLGVDPELSAVFKLLDGAPPKAVLHWARDPHEKSLGEAAAEYVAELVADHRLSSLDLRNSLPGSPNFLAILCHCLLPLDRSEVCAWVLEDPALTTQCILQALSGPPLKNLGELSRSLVDLVPLKSLTHSDIRDRLQGRADRGLGRSIVDRVAPEVVLNLLSGGELPDLDWRNWPSPVIFPWLRRSQGPRLRTLAEQAINRESLGRLSEMVQPDLPSWQRDDNAWLGELVLLALPRAGGASIRASSELLSHVARVVGTPSARVISAEVLGKLRTEPDCLEAGLVVEHFPRMYPDLHSGYGWMFDKVSWWLELSGVDGWDKAKDWRDWLLDTWVQRRWPADGLLTILCCDERLADKVLTHMSKQGHRRLLQEMATASRGRSLNGPGSKVVYTLLHKFT